MEEETAKFNSGLAKLERIHKIKLAMIQYRISNDSGNWLDTLELWRDELNYKFTDAERKDCDLDEQNLEKLSNNDSVTLRKKLKYYSRKLGDLEYKYGLGMPDNDTGFHIDDEV